MAHCRDDMAFQPLPGGLRRQNATGNRREHRMHRFSQFRQIFQEIGWTAPRAQPRLLDQSTISRIKDTVCRSPVDNVTPVDQSLDVTSLTCAAAGVHEVKDEVAAHIRICLQTRFFCTGQYNLLVGF